MQVFNRLFRRPKGSMLIITILIISWVTHLEALGPKRSELSDCNKVNFFLLNKKKDISLCKLMKKINNKSTLRLLFVDERCASCEKLLKILSRKTNSATQKIYLAVWREQSFKWMALINKMGISLGVLNIDSILKNNKKDRGEINSEKTLEVEKFTPQLLTFKFEQTNLAPKANVGLKDRHEFSLDRSTKEGAVKSGKNIFNKSIKKVISLEKIYGKNKIIQKLFSKS